MQQKYCNKMYFITQRTFFVLQNNHVKHESVQNTQNNRKQHCGSYTERKDRACLTWAERLQHINTVDVSPLTAVWWHQVITPWGLVSTNLGSKLILGCI